MNTVADENIVAEVLAIFREFPAEAETKIEEYLGEKFSQNKNLVLLDSLIEEFAPIDETDERDLATALLGDYVATGNLDSDVANQKLIASMETVVKSLGEMIDGLNVSMNVEPTATKTIQETLVASIESANGEAELVAYLDQLKFAYASMYEGFKLATSAQIKKLLAELSPEKMAAGVESKLNVGPFKKAQMFDVYCEKHQNLSSYIDRSIFMESLLHKFESESQRVFLKKRGNND